MQVSKSFSKADVENARELLEAANLTDYEATVLSYLMVLGESKASDIIEVSEVPSAKVYETLNELFRRGLIEKKPGRPTRYLPKAPEAVISSLISEKQSTFKEKIAKLKSLKQEFKETIHPLWKQGRQEERHHPLLRIVKVGKPSERETKQLLRAADETILLFSKVLEYFPSVKAPLQEALNRGVNLKLILYAQETLKAEEKRIQEHILEEMQQTLPKPFRVRYAQRVPLRGTIVDPGVGKGAVFLVEEVGVPLFLREAAVTSNPKLVQALAHYFNLLWQSLEER